MKSQPKILKELSPDALSQLEAASNYTYLTYKDGSKDLSSYSLKVFAEHFTTKHFIRINRSILVNTSFVKRHFTAEGKEYLELKDKTTITIPRRKSESLKQAYPNIFNN